MHLLRQEVQVLQQSVQAQTFVADVYEDITASVECTEWKGHPLLQLHLHHHSDVSEHV